MSVNVEQIVMRYLTIMQCPHGAYAISVDDDNGGIRIAGDRCCNIWNDVKRFPMTPTTLRESANELECAAEQMEIESA